MSVNKRQGIGSVRRFFDRHGISFKKSVRAAEQDRPDVAAAGRTAWADNQPKLDPDRLVFIGETGTSTKMARLRGRLHAVNGRSAKSGTVTGKPPPLLRACAPQLLRHHASSTAR
jgi:hypothetical protein